MNNEQEKQQKQETQEVQKPTKKDAVSKILESAMREAEEEGTDPELVRGFLLEGISKLKAFLHSKELKQLREKMAGFSEWISGTRSQRDFSGLIAWAQIFEGIKPFMPFIFEELENNPHYKDMTFDDFMRMYDENGQRIESEFEKLIIRAQERHETATAAATMLETLPRLLKPKEHITSITRLSAEMHNGGIINAGELNLPVKNEGRTNEITTFVKVSIEELEGVTIKTKNYSEFERQIDDAVYSLMRAGNKYITAISVWYAMTEKRIREDDKRIAEIEAYLEKHRHIDVEIDATEEVLDYMRRNRIAHEKNFTFYRKNYLLPLGVYGLTKGKYKLKVFEIVAEPPLLLYAEATNKRLTYKTRLLNVKDETGASLSDNETRIAIKGYLLRRIKQIKRDAEQKNPKMSDTILLESLFEDVGIKTLDAKTDARKYIITALEYWKAEGLLTEYKKRMNKTGRGIEAIIIKA